MKTTTVRIPVLVDERGRWAAIHSHSLPDEDTNWSLMDEMIDHETPLRASRRVWVTATLPLPEADDVEIDATAVQEVP